MNTPTKYTQFQPLKPTDVLPSLWLRNKDEPDHLFMVLSADKNGVSIVREDKVEVVSYSGLASMLSKWEMSRDGGKTWVLPKIGCIPPHDANEPR